MLAVEDNPALRRILVRHLKSAGYRTFEAETAGAALEILRTQAIRLVFSDVVMPGGMSGFDLARKVMDNWPEVKIILTSGFPDFKLNGSLGYGGKIRLLPKPYRTAQLDEMIAELLH